MKWYNINWNNIVFRVPESCCTLLICSKMTKGTFHLWFFKFQNDLMFRLNAQYSTMIFRLNTIMIAFVIIIPIMTKTKRLSHSGKKQNFRMKIAVITSWFCNLIKYWYMTHQDVQKAGFLLPPHYIFWT